MYTLLRVAAGESYALYTFASPRESRKLELFIARSHNPQCQRHALQVQVHQGSAHVREVSALLRPGAVRIYLVSGRHQSNWYTRLHTMLQAALQREMGVLDPL